MDALLTFSEEPTVREHRAYVRRLKDACAAFGNPNGRMPPALRESLLRRREEILLHDVYFSSFSVHPAPSEAVRRRFGSEDSFLYELFLLGKEADGGFLWIMPPGRGGQIRFGVGKLPVSSPPALAVDLCEHAYFPDYGFARERYLRAALSHLNFSGLNL